MAFSQEWVYRLDDNFFPKKARNGVETSDIKKKNHYLNFGSFIGLVVVINHESLRL